MLCVNPSGGGLRRRFMQLNASNDGYQIQNVKSRRQSYHTGYQVVIAIILMRLSL